MTDRNIWVCQDCEQTHDNTITKKQFEHAKKKWANKWEPYADQQNVRSLDDFYRHQGITELWSHNCPVTHEDQTISKTWSYSELKSLLG